MNSNQRRKQRRRLARAPFQVTFTENLHSQSVSDFMNVWISETKPYIDPALIKECVDEEGITHFDGHLIPSVKFKIEHLDPNKTMMSTVPKGFVKPLTVEQFEKFKESFKLYPKEILNSDGSPLPSLPIVLDLNISFDHEQHARYQASKNMAEADTPVQVQSGSVGTPSTDTGSVSDQ